MGSDSFAHLLLSAGAARGLSELASIAGKRPRPNEPPSSTVPSVAEAQQLVALAEELLQLTVTVERAHGTSWEAIGRTLGITRSTAHGRFSPDGLEDGGLADPERELAGKVDAVFDIAERAKRPFTNSAAHLDRAARSSLMAGLRRVANDHTAAFPARMRAVELITTLEPQLGEESLLELTASYGHGALDLEEPESRAVEGSAYFRLMEQLTAKSGTGSSMTGQEADFLVTSYRAVLDRVPRHTLMAHRAAGNLARALRARFAVRGESGDLDEAITLLDALTGELDVPDRSDLLVWLASALLDRFGMTSSRGDLILARKTLLVDLEPDSSLVVALARFVTALQRLATASASIGDWRESERAIREALLYLDRFASRRTTALVVGVRLMLACLHAERGDLELSRAEAERAFDEARADLSENHALTNLARQVQVTILLGLDHGADDVPDILRVLEDLGHGIRGPRHR